MLVKVARWAWNGIPVLLDKTSAASEIIFHNEVSKLFVGLSGVTTLHDNLLIYGTDYDGHCKNLKAFRERCR